MIQLKTKRSPGRNRGETTVEGALNSLSNRIFRIRFFSNPSGSEGKKYIGAKSNGTTNANGNVSFAFKPENKVPAGQTVTATATRGSTGDTSEFSGPEEVSKPGQEIAPSSRP
jgi:hypothetical protein